MSVPDDVIVLGCGYTGRALVRKLIERGARVTATVRRREAAPSVEALGASPLLWSAPEPLPRSYPLAFVLFPPRGVDPRAVAGCLERVDRVVYCSSTSVYGPQAGGHVEEASEVSPRSPWAVARVEAENALRGQGAVVVRAAGIYGPGRSVVERARAGRLRNAGDPERPVNLIHVEDLCDVLIAAAERAVPGSVHLAASGDPIPWRRLAEAACVLAGRRFPERSALPNDPNIRMFYEETKRCMPTSHERLGVRLRHPDVVRALYEMEREAMGPR